MRVFVTGATGFLGRHLALRLLAEGHAVIALVRNPSKAADLAAQGVHIVPGDITKPTHLSQAMAGCEELYHVAAWYELGVADLQAMRTVNVEGTRHVLQAAIDTAIPSIVYCSSVAVLGPSSKESPSDESLTLRSTFTSYYEQTKYEAHRVAQEFATTGAPIRIALPGTIFGPGDQSLVALLFRAHLARKLVAFALSDTTMSLVYVEDCVAGLIAAARRGRPGGEYNLVAKTLSLGQWIAAMAEITGYSRPFFEIPQPVLRLGTKVFPLIARPLGLAPGVLHDGLAMGCGKHWNFSAHRARLELGWQPTDFRIRLAETLLAFDPHYGAHFRPQTAPATEALAVARKNLSAVLPPPHT